MHPLSRLSAWALLGALLTVAFVGTHPQAASAQCECGASGAEAIDASPAAALGTVLGRAEGLWVVDVTNDVKGTLPGQVAIRSNDNHACEVQWLAGRDIAVVLEIGADGVLEANGCSELEPATLADWSQPTGSPGPVETIAAGRWGPYRIIAAGADGLPLAYGFQPGQVTSISVCPGSERMVETASLADGTTELVVRSLTTFGTERQTPLTLSNGEALETTESRCLDDKADEVLLLFDDEVLRVGSDGTTEVDQAAPWPNREGDEVIDTASANLNPSYLLAATVVVEPTDPAALVTVPVAPAPTELEFAAPPPSTGGWSPWLFVLAAAGGVIYLARKSTDPAWRASWSKPDNGRNSRGRRREDATGKGHFN